MKRSEVDGLLEAKDDFLMPAVFLLKLNSTEMHIQTLSGSSEIPG